MPFVFYKHKKEKYTHDRNAIITIVSQVFYFFENVSVSLES